MPLFLRHRLLFIHIPKCGGDTVSFALKSRGDPPFLFVADGAVRVNGHTPQHMNWRELRAAGWTTPPGFRVAALVRHPVDRVLSEYRYLRAARPDLQEFASTPGVFLDHFLSRTPAARRRFDNHNAGLREFLCDRDGKIGAEIHLRPLAQVDLWLQELGLPPIGPHERRNVTASQGAPHDFSAEDLERIRAHFSADIAWFEARFPQARVTESNDLQP